MDNEVIEYLSEIYQHVDQFRKDDQTFYELLLNQWMTRSYAVSGSMFRRKCCGQMLVDIWFWEMTIRKTKDLKSFLKKVYAKVSDR